jgi:uncharacterized membrane protein YphA (DoxX/SURF4 family)
MHSHDIAIVFARLALAAGFLSAVADRLGVCGPYGTVNVAWGDMEHFLAYTARLNPWFPASFIPFVGWVATIAEVVLALLLLVGWRTRFAAVASGFLMIAFAAGMSAGPGIKTALNASVFAAGAAAFLLAGADRYALSVDAVRSAGATYSK